MFTLGIRECFEPSWDIAHGFKGNTLWVYHAFWTPYYSSPSYILGFGGHKMEDFGQRHWNQFIETLMLQLKKKSHMIFKGVATMSWALPMYYGYKRIQKPFNISTQLLEKPMKWWTTMISPFFLRRLATKHSAWLYKTLWLLKSFTRLQGWFMNFWILTLDLRSRTGRLATIH